MSVFIAPGVCVCVCVCGGGGGGVDFGGEHKVFTEGETDRGTCVAKRR